MSSRKGIGFCQQSETTYLIYRSSFYAFYMRFSPLIRLKKHKLDQIESFGRIFVTHTFEKSKSSKLERTLSKDIF